MGTLLVTGSRDWGWSGKDYRSRERVQDEWRTASRVVRLLHVRWGGRARLINGVAVGADQIVRSYASNLGWVLEDHYPKQYQLAGMSYGQACYARNAGMVHSLHVLAQEGEQIHALALWKNRSRGTGHTIDLLRAQGIEPEIIALP